MNQRLLDIIKYKTGGKQTEFATLMGWSPQYLTKLLKGDNFGITPVVKILSQFPEISARWFLLGEGDMLSDDGISSLRKIMHERMLSILEVEKYMPVMSGDELRNYEQVITGNKEPYFSPELLDKWQGLLQDRENEINMKFKAANAHSEKICSKAKTKK